ncbi:MAG TPA: MATE family efflux transporter [Vicinamibacteria bacterium]|jgi:putative MATE family efflux protein
MKDLTRGPVGRHVVDLATFIALTMVFQTLYFLADLYFVGRLGKEAVAGVGLAGNLMFIVLALTQSMSVGATSLISQSLGRKDRAQAQLLFNQALALSILTGIVFGALFFALREVYARRLAADAVTAVLGIQYLTWFVPALFLQFPLVILGAALRAMGDVKLPTVIQVATVILNIVLAPVLIFGWGTGRPLGVAGAAIASLVAVGVACAAFILYFRRAASPLRFAAAEWTPRPRRWGAMLRIGLPAGGEFALVSVYMVLVYDIIRPFGAAAQAGFGIGIRVIQALFLPTVAIAFAAAPVAGQNYGAGLGGRVRKTFYSAATMSATIMLALTLLCEIAPAGMIRFFNGDPGVVSFGSEYLRITCWNFLASGIVFVSSSVFQGMGNTLPPLGASALRLLLFAIPAYAVSHQPGFQLRHVWYLSVASVTVQLVVNLWLLHREFARKLPPLEMREPQAVAAGT